MAEKTLNGRIIQKHDTEANWLKATNFKPKAGEVIIYDVDENYSYPRIKIGDGNTLVNELPFAATRPDWNAAEGEEGYIGNKPNVVKSINGVVPDENGNSQIPTVDVIQFIDASGFGGGIQCNKTVEEAYNTSTGAGVLIVYRRIWVSSNDGNPTDAYTSTIYKRDSQAKKLTIDFNDGRAPIVVDANNNTITLDPDWVAPAEPVKTINSVAPDENGNVQIPQANWEQNDETAPDYIKGRTHYSTYTNEPIFNEYTITGTGTWIRDQSILADVIVGQEYLVTYNGQEYMCVAYDHPAFGVSLGNSSIVAGNNDTGEPFYFGNLMLAMTQVIAYFKEDIEHTFSISGVVETITPIPGKYIAGGVYKGTGAGATIVGSSVAIASGEYSVAVNNAIAQGESAFAEGFGHAKGKYAHAEGAWTYANSNYSHAEGLYTDASSQSQHVQGKYNIEDATGKYAHIVGNGEAYDNRSNAHTLDWDGNAWFQGNVFVGGTNQEDGAKLATENFVTEQLAANPVVQSDWDETDETSLAFIKNKPEAATDEEIIDMMLSIDMMPVVQDADGSILVDSDEAILMI